MAVVNIREVYPGVSLGLWQMDESPEQLFDLYPHLLPYRSSLDDKYKQAFVQGLSCQHLSHKRLCCPYFVEKIRGGRGH